jgi:hypothetical protein
MTALEVQPIEPYESSELSLTVVPAAEHEPLTAADIEYAMQIAFLLGRGVVLHEIVTSDHDARMKRMQELLAPEKGHPSSELNINGER